MRSLAVLLGVASLGASAPAEEGNRGGIVALAGVAQQSDAAVVGVGGAWRYRFLGADLAAQAGVGLDFWVLRPSLHAIVEARLSGFVIYALGGPSLLFYRTRGGYAEFCEKADLDCDTVVFGLDLGLGLGLGWLTLEGYYGTGELPLMTLVGKATWLF
jgi:hypothetical protein